MAQLHKGRLDEALEWLAEIARLEPDWDSYGALRPSPAAVDRARTFIGRAVVRLGPVGAPHEVMPIADGGISLEWRYPTVELGLNACPEGGWTSLLVERNGPDRRARSSYNLSDDDALEQVVHIVAATPA